MEYIPNIIFNLKNILVTWEQFAQSISTQYSCFENQGWFVTLKKLGTLLFEKKQGAKNQGHCYSKSEEAAWSILFLNNNDPAIWKKQGPRFFNSSRP